MRLAIYLVLNFLFIGVGSLGTIYAVDRVTGRKLLFYRGQVAVLLLSGFFPYFVMILLVRETVDLLIRALVELDTRLLRWGRPKSVKAATAGEVQDENA